MEAQGPESAPKPGNKTEWEKREEPKRTSSRPSRGGLVECIPAIADVDALLVVGSRLKKPIKHTGGSRVSGDRKRKSAVENEVVPLPLEESKCLASLPFNRFELRISAEEDPGETVMSR